MPNSGSSAEQRNSSAVVERYQPLILVVVALAGGIIADRYAPRSVTQWFTMGAIGLLAWFVFFFQRIHRVASVLLCLSVFTAGAAWHHYAWHIFEADEVGLLAHEESAPLCVEATALTSPRWSPAPPPHPMTAMPVGEHSELQVSIRAVRNGERWEPASGIATLRVEGHLLDVHSGDQLRCFARISAPTRPRNPGEFDFAENERGQRRLCRLSIDTPAAILVVARGATWSWRGWLNQARETGNRLLWKHIEPQQASLAAAVLIGAREQLDYEQTQGFFTTGIVHILAISGLHVGILAIGIWWLAKFSPLPRSWTLFMAGGIVVVYAVLTDMQPPVVRSAVLVASVCAARYWGRRGLAFNTLAAAGVVVLLLNPCSLFQAGTQLSFLAVAALCCWNPLAESQPTHDPLQQLLERTEPLFVRIVKRTGNWIRAAFLTSALVWLVTLPLVWYRFHLISPVSLILNPIVMLPIALALYAGFGVLALGWLVPPLGEACGWLCGASLAFIERGIEASLAIRGNHFFLPAPSLAWVLTVYLVLAVTVAFPKLRPSRRWRMTICAVAFSLGFMTSGTSWLTLPLLSQKGEQRSRELAVTFIAVGHGTSVLIELPDGRNILYDAGRMGDPTSSSRPIAATLWSRGITHLDAIVVSHADTDHYNAIPDLLTKFSVGAIYVSPVMFDDETNALTMLQNMIVAAQVPLRELTADDILGPEGEVRMTAIHPPQHGIAGSDNANSIVLRIDYAGRRILLPGDLESPGLEDVIAEEPLDCDVVMVPHHGSRRSNPSGFARWTTPEWVVISGAHGHDASFVTETYAAAGAEVFHTAEDGAVRVCITPTGNMTVAAWRQNPWP